MATTEISLDITKKQMEAAVPASREPKSIIFDKLKPRFLETIRDIAEDKLGDVAIAVVNAEPEGVLANLVRNLAVQDVFLRELHGLDLVLTATGFGVVSTNDTAPASKIRVDAFDGELRVKWLMTHDSLLEALFRIPGWYAQNLLQLDTLFYRFAFLKRFAGFQAPLAKDWETAQPLIMEADRYLRDRISDEFMDELILQTATAGVTEDNAGVIYQIRRYIGVWVQGNHAVAIEYYRRLMNTLEREIGKYPTYASSDAYTRNHMEPYENTADKGAFHFVG